MLHTRQFLAVTALFLFGSASAQAQYVWVEANGTRQYSDQPPPPNIPANKILKSPRSMPAEEAVNLEDAPADAAAVAAPKEPASVAEREKAYRERAKAKSEQQANDKLAKDNERIKAQNCAAARETQAQLAAGTRLAQYDAKGERTFMSDEERAKRSARARQTVQDCR